MEERIRFSIDMFEASRTQLVALAKQHKITQGEVLEVLLARAALDNGLAAALDAQREAKVMARNPKKAILERLKGMTAEQLAALESSVG